MKFDMDSLEQSYKNTFENILRDCCFSILEEIPSGMPQVFFLENRA